MRLIVLAATAAVLSAASPVAAVDLPADRPGKLTALPDDWLDKDLEPDSADADRRADADIERSESGGASDEQLAGNAADCRPTSGTTGAILGAVAGGLLGNIIDGGRHRAAGTIVGAGGGALLGRSIEQRRGCK